MIDIKELKVNQTVNVEDIAQLLNQISDDLVIILTNVEALRVRSSRSYDGEEEKRAALNSIIRLLSTVCDLYNQLQTGVDISG